MAFPQFTRLTPQIMDYYRAERAECDRIGEQRLSLPQLELWQVRDRHVAELGDRIYTIIGGLNQHAGNGTPEQVRQNLQAFGEVLDIARLESACMAAIYNCKADNLQVLFEGADAQNLGAELRKRLVGVERDCLEPRYQAIKEVLRRNIAPAAAPAAAAAAAAAAASALYNASFHLARVEGFVMALEYSLTDKDNEAIIMNTWSEIQRLSACLRSKTQPIDTTSQQAYNLYERIKEQSIACFQRKVAGKTPEQFNEIFALSQQYLIQGLTRSARRVAADQPALAAQILAQAAHEKLIMSSIRTTTPLTELAKASAEQCYREAQGQ
jgi:hypothetical protein